MVMVLPDPCLVILCGPAGSGKSTFAQAHFAETAVVSSDRCRALIADDEQELRVSGAAFVLFHQIIDSRLRFRRLTVADSTALHPDARRGRRVARAVIHRQWQQLQSAIRGVPQEGYEQVVVLGPADVEQASVRIDR